MPTNSSGCPRSQTRDPISVPLEIDTALRWGLLQDSWLDQADALAVHLQITAPGRQHVLHRG
jgi:hypothetical protein